MLYFAYGSNLSSARMKHRVPVCRLVATGVLEHHRLAFHKIGQDGSGKCDAYFTGNREEYILGALYRIDAVYQEFLDRAEGLGNGYVIKNVDVIITGSRSRTSAFLYSATRIDRRRKPFHWYKEHVLRGMREHSFPEEYLARAAEVEAIADPDAARAARELQIYPVGAVMDYP